MVKWNNTENVCFIKTVMTTPPKPCLTDIISQDNLKFLAYYQDVLEGCKELDEVYSLRDATSSELAYYMGVNTTHDLGVIASYIIQEAELKGYDFDLASILQPVKQSSNVMDTGLIDTPVVKLTDETIRVANAAYKDRDYVTSLICNDKLCIIGTEAFANCKHLKEVSLSPNIVHIGRSAFRNCDLEYLSIPSGIDTIQDRCFSDNTHLSEVQLNEGLMEIEDYAFTGCSSLLHLSLPESVTKLSNGAFALCYGLTDVNLGNVAEIGDYCFYRCRSLTSVTLPTTVTVLGANVFSECVHLEEITLYDNIGNVAADAFKGIDKRVKIRIKQKDGLGASMLIAQLNRHHITYEVI